MVDPREIARMDLDALAQNLPHFKDRIKEYKADHQGPVDDRYLRDLIALFVVRWHNYAWIGDKKGEYRKFYKGAWRSEVDVSVNRLIRDYCRECGIKINKSIRDDLRMIIKEVLQLDPEDFNRDRSVVNFTNGFVSLKSRAFMPHPGDGSGEQFLFTVQIPHAYRPGLTPLRFLPWLWETLDGDAVRVDLVLKSMGYALTLLVKYQKLFMIKGDRHTGKSTFLNILHNLVGTRNASSVALQRLAKKFGTSGIMGKTLNFHADIPTDKPVADTSQIKTLIDDTIDVEVKGGGVGMTITNITKHFFSANNMPPVKGLDLAYARRWCIIEFNHVIKKENVIADFEGSIINDENEMEAIVSLAMDAFFELEDEGRFKAQDEETVLEMIMEETDVVYRFLKSECERGPTFNAVQDEIYQAYVDFATAAGATEVLKKAGFTSDLYSKGFSWGRASHKVEGKRPYTYTGLRLKPEGAGRAPPAPVVEVEGLDLSAPTGSLLEEACRAEIEDEIYKMDSFDVRFDDDEDDE